MCNLSQGIKEDGMAEIFARMSRKGYSPEQIAEMTDTDVKGLLERQNAVKMLPILTVLFDFYPTLKSFLGCLFIRISRCFAVETWV